MQRMLLLLSGLLCVVTPVFAGGGDGRAGPGTHHEVNTIVTKIASGFVFVEPFEGLRPRAISPAKADRVGLHQTKVGEEVTLVVDEGNLLVDAHRPSVPSPGHRLINGALDFADAYWGEVKLSTPDGPQRFEVDSLIGSKIAVIPEGASVVVELDEDNMLIDIHRRR
ncbi:hypothetical protein [Candidatus Nitrospira bockiana]